MKKLYILLIFLICKPSIAQETFPVNGVANNFKPIYAFINAHITISPGISIKNGILLIQDKKIIAVDSNITVPEEAIIFDLNGDYIYPSFIDLYSDYGVPKPKVAQKNRIQYKSNKMGAYHWNESIKPEINSSKIFSKNNKKSKKYLSNGFGSVLTHTQDGLIRGVGCLVALSNKTDNENLLISNAANFYSFKKGVSKQKNPTSLMGSIALIRQAFLDAEWYKTQNEQVNLSYMSMIENQKLPHIFSIDDELNYSRVYKIAEEFEIDFIIKGNGLECLILDEIKNYSLPVIIPINFPKAYDVSNPEASEWISLEELKEWELAPYNPVLLAKENINFCITSSGIKNTSQFYQNIRETIKKGLNKKDALAALTTNPAKLINASDKLGALKKGMLANFIITSDDIFEKGIIYENWVLGEQNVINEKQNDDIRGYYSFSSLEYQNQKFKITGNETNLKSYFLALDSTELKTIKDNNKLLFFNKDGDFRATGEFKNGIIEGRYQNSNGIFHSFSMKLDSILPKEKTNEFEEVSKAHSIPEIWTPNKSNGFASSPKQENVLFKNTTVWTNENEGILQNTDVLISNGKIIAIGLLINPNDYLRNENYKTIDASSLHLTCGIIDEHSHIGISGGVNESSESVTSEVRIGDVINPNDHNIYRQLAGGTTTAQLLHGSANPIGGQSAIIKLRWGENAEGMKIANADGFIKFALGENVKQSNWGDAEKIRFPQTRMGVEQVFYDAFFRAKNYKKQWKEYNKLTRKEKRTIAPPREDLELNALVEILDSNRFITCHSYIQSEINMLMHVADSMGIQINTFTHILEGYKVAEKMKKHGVGGSTFSDWWAYKYEVNDAIPYNATLLNNAGVITAINSDDAEMGRRLNQEAAKAIKYGKTSEEEAWKMVTLNPAKLLHLDQQIGSIKVGKDADIVLWSNNPLSIYAKVIETYVDGRLMYSAAEHNDLQKRDRLERMRIIKLMSKEKNPKQKKNPKPHIERLYRCCKH